MTIDLSSFRVSFDMNHAFYSTSLTVNVPTIESFKGTTRPAPRKILPFNSLRVKLNLIIVPILVHYHHRNGIGEMPP